MNYQEIFRWLAIAVGIGGMITWMITYQLCVTYFIFGKKYYDKKLDGYDIHFFIIAMASIYMNYHLKYMVHLKYHNWLGIL